MADPNVIDVSRLLEDRSLALSPDYSRALLSIALAFAEYAGLDGDELARLIETARTADGVELGTVAVLLEAVGFDRANTRPSE
jgi:hypothetical protein